MCVFSPQRPTRMHAFSPQCTFPTMYRLYVCVYFPHNDQLGCTHFPHNAFSSQYTFPTMYRLYVCVYFPHNDQLGCTHFPHNAFSPQCTFPTIYHLYVCVYFSPQRPTRMHASSPQCIVCTYRCVCVCVVMLTDDNVSEAETELQVKTLTAVDHFVCCRSSKKVRISAVN